jgi:transposase
VNTASGASLAKAAGRWSFVETVVGLVELQPRDAWVTALNHKIQQVFRDHPICQRIAHVEGVGPITTTAVMAAVGNAKEFRNGRAMAVWIGLVPRRYSSGGRTRLLGISKQGDRYLRTLLMHGGRAVVRRAAHKKDVRSRWVPDIRARHGPHIANVAVANKHARSF